MACLFAISAALVCLSVAFKSLTAALVFAGFAAILYPFLKA